VQKDCQIQDSAQHSHFQDHVVRMDSHQKHTYRRVEQAVAGPLVEVEEVDSLVERRAQLPGQVQPQPYQAQLVGGIVVEQHQEGAGIDLFEDRILAG
jgi:hypothetical protein